MLLRACQLSRVRGAFMGGASNGMPTNVSYRNECKNALVAIAKNPVTRGKRDGYNPAGAAHKDVRRFRRRRMRLTEIPGLLANPAAPSPGAPLGRLSSGYFDQPFGLLKSASLPFKEK